MSVGNYKYLRNPFLGLFCLSTAPTGSDDGEQQNVFPHAQMHRFIYSCHNESKLHTFGGGNIC